VSCFRQKATATHADTLRGDFLSRRGYVAVEVGEDEADILIPGAGTSFEAVALLMSEIGIWRAKQASAQVVIEPGG